MNNILVINTGGTFNKLYDSINGELLVDGSSNALNVISKNWLCEFEIVNIIGKDSLEFDDNDRNIILQTIKNHTSNNKFIIIHGTDTMHITAEFLDLNIKDKYIVITGAMVPFSINTIEATANFASSAGYINNIKEFGIYICMNGLCGKYNNIIKNREIGKFIQK
ncbi:MAG: asparaginase domain-containing protein [Sulfurovaceae bacterium]|nr:asparaginase domain-containing protein [Sulfurovaceae bacterium]